MAEQHEHSLIGYDPLAWMQNQSLESPLAEEALVEFTETAQPDYPNESILNRVTEVDDLSGQQKIIDFAVAEADADEVTASIMLDSVLNIQNVADLYQKFLKVLDANQKIEIDASAVNIADTASLQLLLILKRTALKQQKQVVIDFPSDKFILAAELLGISEMLEVDQAASGLF